MAAGQLANVRDALLEQVSPALRPVLEEAQGIGGLGVLAQHDDTQARVQGAQLIGGTYTLIGPGRRHSDVGDHDVGGLFLDGLQKRWVVDAGGHELQVGLQVDQLADALSDQVVVLGQHDSEGHPASL